VCGRKHALGQIFSPHLRLLCTTICNTKHSLIVLAKLFRLTAGCNLASRKNLYLRSIPRRYADAEGVHDPRFLFRKGSRTGGVRDYHWSAALAFRMIADFGADLAARGRL